MTVPISPSDMTYKHVYVIVSDRTVWGKPGDEVELEMTENQELSLLQSGAVTRKEEEAAAETVGNEAEEEAVD